MTAGKYFTLGNGANCTCTSTATQADTLPVFHIMLIKSQTVPIMDKQTAVGHDLATCMPGFAHLFSSHLTVIVGGKNQERPVKMLLHVTNVLQRSLSK